MTKKTQKKKTTCIKATRLLFPGADDDMIDGIIWSCSAFPFDTWENCFKQLQDISKRAKGDPTRALDIAFSEIEEAMNNIKDSDHKKE